MEPLRDRSGELPTVGSTPSGEGALQWSRCVIAAERVSQERSSSNHCQASMEPLRDRSGELGERSRVRAVPRRFNGAAA